PPGGESPTPRMPGGVPPLAANVRIEFEDIQDRARPVTSGRDGVGAATLSPNARTVIFTSSAGGQTGWWAADIISGTTNRITNGGETGGAVQFMPDGGRFYFVGTGGTIQQMSPGAPGPARVGFNAILDLNRRAEIAEAF